MIADPRPQVTLKLATSLDGRIATATGESRWITGEAARAEGHRLRAAHHVVMVGSQTVLDDDPQLTVRVPGYDGAQPARIVADARLRTPLDSRLARSAADHAAVTMIVTARAGDEAATRPFKDLGVAVFDGVAARGGGVTVASLLQAVDGLGHESLLIEGGGRLAAAFLQAGVVDRIEWFRAPMVLGAAGRPGVGDLVYDRLAAAPRFTRIAVRDVGVDLWERYARVDTSNEAAA